MLKDFTVSERHSYDQSLAGEGRPFEEVFDELKRGLAWWIHIKLSLLRIDEKAKRVYILNVVYNKRDQLRILAQMDTK